MISTGQSELGGLPENNLQTDISCDFRDVRVFSLPNASGGKLCEICMTACSLFRAQSDIYLRDVTVFPDPPVVRSIRFYCRHLCTHGVSVMLIDFLCVCTGGVA